jgi:hypothetical protein
MDWSKIVGFVSGAAPFLGSLVGGKAGEMVGGLAGSGIKMIAAALGVTPTQDAIADAIATDPNAALKLKEFEMTNKLELQKLAVQQIGMELADVQSARTMSSDKMKATGKGDLNLYVLAWTIIVGFFVLMGVLLFRILPPDTSGVLFMLFGALSAGFGQVLNFFFGSNKSSENKTAMIYNSTPNVPKKQVD